MDRIRINGIDIYQPDSGSLEYNFETTYTSDSTRVQSGQGHFTALFTVEQLGYTATMVPIEEASKILKMIAKGKKFRLHYFSVYSGKWQDAEFYVGKGNCKIGKLTKENSYLSNLSFNMTGVNPI